MSKVKITIDQQVIEVDERKTILSAALDEDIYIPHLCHHPDLPDIGACRLCVVEIEGEDEIKTSCTTKVQEGMIVRTKTEKLNEMRRLSMELMLANHVDDCTGCPKYLKCELQSLIQYLGVSTSRLRRTLHSVNEVTDNPLIIRDLNRCVACGRCVRVCKDIRGVGIINHQLNDEGRVIVGPKDQNKLVDENCRFCGACVEVCPTGALRDKEGVFKPNANRELSLVPCKAECPANIDVPEYIRYINEGKFQEAIAVIREKAPFPHSLGYVCMRFCESACRRKEINESLSIRELKRFAAEKDQGLWREKVKIKSDTGKKVAVIGSGPAGLTTAYYLAKSGHKVTVYEKLPVAGGMLRTGIPAYRLPKETVDEEIAEILRVGVEIKTNTTITSVKMLKDKGYDSVVIAIGAGKGIRLPIEGATLSGVHENIEFLQKTSLGESVDIGKAVIVLGGGNVAFDCARSAIRLGAEKVRVLCLETREKMPADDVEIKEGLEEGIEIINNKSFVAIQDKQGHIAGVVCKEVESFGLDEKGKFNLALEPNSEHLIEGDTVIFATGQHPEIPEGWDVDVTERNYIITQKNSYETSEEGVYAVGDSVYGTSSVIKAIAEARKVAIEIDTYLGSDGCIDDNLSGIQTKEDYIGKDENFLGIERMTEHYCKPETIKDNFDLVSCSCEDEVAVSEASRCLQCDLRVKLSKPKFWADYKVK